AENSRFRDQVMRDFARLAPPAQVLVAEVTPKPKPRLQVLDPEPENEAIAESAAVAPPPPSRPSSVAQQPPRTSPPQQQGTQVLQIDPSTYAQNNFPNAVYWETNGPER